MKNIFSIGFYLVAVVLFPLASFSQVNDAKNLSTLMGAFSKIIDQNTQVKGFNEEKPKLTPTAEKAADDLTNELEDCETTKMDEPELVVVEKDGVSTEFKVYDLKISGVNCPVEMSTSVITQEQAIDKFQGGFKMSVVFKTEALIEKYRARSFNATGVIKSQATKKGSVVTLPVSVEISASGDSLDLGIFSQKIGITATTTMNTANFNFSLTMEQNLAMKYGQVDQKGYAMIKMSGFSEPKQVFQINGQNVSESEFQAFAQSFVIEGSVNEEDPQTPDGRRPTQCKVVAYEKSAISEADLKTALSVSKLPAQGLLVQSQSCSQDTVVTFKSGSSDVDGLLDFQSEWISFGVQNKSTQKSLGDVFVLYGDNAPQTSQSENMVLGLKCESVPACQ